MDLNDVAVFCTVAETGSFTAAADSLRMPVATVSRRVGMLESSLGQQLLYRSTRSLELTETGRHLLIGAVPLLDEFSALEQSTHAQKTQAQGTLRLQLPLELFADDLVTCLQGFMTKFPEVNVHCRQYLGWKQYPPEDFDLTLICYEINLPASDWIAVPLLSLRQGLFASPKLTIKTPLTVEQITNYPTISRYDENLWHFRHGPDLESLTINSRCKLDSLSLQIQAAENGLGIIKAPYNSVEQALKSKSLVELATPFPLVALSVALFYRSRVQAARVKVFMDYLQGYLATGSQALTRNFKKKPRK